MINWFIELDAWIQALLATLFTWGLTALGASIVLIFKNISKKFLNTIIGFSAGIMIAASIWSLIIPSVELSSELGGINWIPVTFGIIIGALFLYFADFISEVAYFSQQEQNSSTSQKKRNFLLVTSITLHNIPEGFAIGVAFGAASIGLFGASLGTAIALAIGIGLQNLPEGAAVSLPLREDGTSRRKAFFYGQISGVVEPFAGILGALLVLHIRVMLPYTLGFAAGAMLYVAVKELIPTSQEEKESILPTFGFIIGFLLMMILDITLG